MKKKFGFTLAEVLITLGIIGVIATLTTPALVKNSGQAKIGPSLAKFVNTFETASKQMMLDQGKNKLSAGAKIPTGELSNYIVMTPVTEIHEYTDGKGEGTYAFSNIVNNYKSSDDPDNPGNYTNHTETIEADTWMLKDGAIISFLPSYHEKLENKGAYKEIIGLCYIDINGAAKPNVAGKDVFAFIIDQSGTLIPVGSNAHKYIATDPAFTRSNKTFTNYEANCVPNSDSLEENFACTGKIADNNWNADY